MSFGFRLPPRTRPRNSATWRPAAGRWGRALDQLPLEAKVDRWGMEAGRRRAPAPADAEPDRPPPRAADPRLRLARPGPGPRRIPRSSDWRSGRIRNSEHGGWRVLRCFNLNICSKRLALVACHAEPHERKPGSRRLSSISTPQSPARRCSWTASSSGASPGARGPSGNRPPQTSPRGSSGGSFILSEIRGLASPPSGPRVARELRAPAGARAGDHRQRLGVCLQGVRRGGLVGGCPPVADQGRAPELERRCRAGPADDPRGVLAAGLRSIIGPEDHRPSARPRRKPR